VHRTRQMRFAVAAWFPVRGKARLAPGCCSCPELQLSPGPCRGPFASGSTREERPRLIIDVLPGAAESDLVSFDDCEHGGHVRGRVHCRSGTSSSPARVGGFGCGLEGGSGTSSWPATLLSGGEISHRTRPRTRHCQHEQFAELRNAELRKIRKLAAANSRHGPAAWTWVLCRASLETS
jgi:hypothetical protein